MKRKIAAVLVFVCVLGGLQAAAQSRHALLIGINTYQPEGTTAEHAAGCTYGRCELASFENLAGSVSDAQAMADVLTSPKFGFPTGQVVLLTNPAPPQPGPGVVVLPASQTSRDGILAAMQKYLVEVPRAGDTVVFYDASHGSLRVNSLGNKLTVLVNGKYVHADSTLVPADAYKGGYDVRDRELTRIFNAALDKGIHLTVIFDSCHSGGATRGIGPKYVERSLAYDPRDIKEAPDAQATPPTERKQNPALVFSAAQQDQTAKESPVTATMHEPHGAFTAALVEALQVLPADAPASVVYERVRAVLEGNGVSDQEPDLDASAARRQQPLFGGVVAGAGKVRAAALKSDDDGSVWLDIGRVSGVGVGSEFTAMSGEKVAVRITGLQGIARSTASVISPLGAKIAAGEVFELTKWVPAESAPLRFWMWPDNLNENEILAAVAVIKAAGVASVSDPAEEPWTDILCWDGANWTLQHAGAAAPIKLGAKLSAAVLKQHLSAGAKLWVNLPPPRELAGKIILNVLAGASTEAGPEYAWFHKSEFTAGPIQSITHDHSPGCSATSPYPVRSDWMAMADTNAGAALNKYAGRLAKVHGWLELADNPTGASLANYYSLALVQAVDQSPVDQPVQQDERLKLALQSVDRVIERRWVYVLDMDCHGAGTLLYPLDYSENKFPNDADNGRQIVLPGARTLRIGPPYGVDTLLLLSTAEPLPDPYALNFEGVAERGARAAETPLQKLLAETSGGKRGGSPAEIPTNWGLDLMTLRSIPRDTAK